MKHEIGKECPRHYKEGWPGMLGGFSHFEFTPGVPQALCLITTRKENGKANAAYHAWQCFTGSGKAYYIIVAGLTVNGHTYKSMRREGAFCVNFLGAQHHAACMKTIEVNGEENDELLDAGLTGEAAKEVSAPRVEEAFLSYECVFEKAHTLDGMDDTALVIGRVVHAAVREGFSTPASICAPDGFLMNIVGPIDPLTGENSQSCVASLKIEPQL